MNKVVGPDGLNQLVRNNFMNVMSRTQCFVVGLGNNALLLLGTLAGCRQWVSLNIFQSEEKCDILLSSAEKLWHALATVHVTNGANV